jgi:hypothetical protein
MLCTVGKECYIKVHKITHTDWNCKCKGLIRLLLIKMHTLEVKVEKGHGISFNSLPSFRGTFM